MVSCLEHYLPAADKCHSGQLFSQFLGVTGVPSVYKDIHVNCPENNLIFHII